MEAARLNVEERPLRLASCEVSNRGSAARTPGIVPATPHQSETATSPLFTNYIQEYDEMLKVDIKTECDDKDSAVIQELTTLHSCVVEDSIAGASLLVREEGGFILKIENEINDMMLKQELDIEPVFLQPKANLNSRPGFSFCNGKPSAPLCTVPAQQARIELKDEHCEGGFEIPANVNSVMGRRCPPRTHEINEKYECDYCKYKSARKSNFISHIRMHVGKRRYKCEHCEYSSSVMGDLKMHKCTHTCEKPYKRLQREFSTSQRNNLKVHVRTHTDEKPYKCEQCEYRASRMNTLQRHLRIHTGKRPYKCGQCEYSAFQLGNLKMHMRAHTGEKPYKCKHCKYSASQTSHLKVHMRIHTGERPYKCDQCEYSASRIDSLKMHMHTHRVEGIYKCDQCEYSTSRKSYLKIHCSKHTSLKSYEPYEFGSFQKSNLKYTYSRKTMTECSRYTAKI